MSISVASSEGSRAERFSLNPTSGELRTASPLRWAERAEYAFTVTAADHGTPGLSSTCQLRIQVTQSPYFNILIHRPAACTNAHTFVVSSKHFYGIWRLGTKANLVAQPKTVTCTHYLSPFAFLAASNFLKLCTKWTVKLSKELGKEINMRSWTCACTNKSIYPI